MYSADIVIVVAIVAFALGVLTTTLAVVFAIQGRDSDWKCRYDHLKKAITKTLEEN